MKQLKTVIYLNTIVASGCTTYCILSHTMLADMWKKTLGLKINNEEVPVPKKMLTLIDNIMKDFKYCDIGKPKIEPFIISGIDLKHWGYSGFKPGALLGIPQNFLYDSRAEVEVIHVDQKDKAHASPGQIQALKESIFLSEEAKKFGLAREIVESNHFSFYPLAVLPLVIVGFINLYYGIVLRRPSDNSKRIALSLRYNFILIAVALYIFIADVTSVYKQGWADFQVAKLGKNYIEGGLEYYQKMLKRNKTIKEINRDAPYADDGDVQISWIRNNSMPIAIRIKYLNDILKARERKAEEPSVWDYVPIFKKIEY